VHKKNQKGQEANASNIALATKPVINDDNSFISDGEMMAEVCCFEQLDTDLMEMTVVDSTATGTSASHNSSQVQIDLDKSVLDKSVTHHLNELTLDAFQQEVATNFLRNEFIDVFTQYCDDSCSSGVSDIKLKRLKQNPVKATIYYLSYHWYHLAEKTNALWKVLFDSGSDKTIVKRLSLPLGIETSIGKKRKILGVNASSTIDQDVLLKDITLPEFSSLLHIPGPICAIIMDTDTQYDLIIGMDIMQVIGLDFHNLSKTIVWNDHRVPSKPHDYFDDAQLHDLLAIAMHDDSFDSIKDFFPATETCLLGGYKSKTIHSSLYEPVSVQDVAQQQRHLSDAQQSDLVCALSQYKKLFSGQFGCYPHRKVHLELKADATPSQSCPYPVPKHHETVFKEELNQLCEIGVLSRCSASTWLSPLYIIPKTDDRVQWISDFRKLNEHIRRKVYHLPKISNILKRRNG
jgi:hypothetical protein